MLAIFIQIYRLIDWHKLREIELKVTAYARLT